jgi:tetratricopeptide (TPR) repeat protein
MATRERRVRSRVGAFAGVVALAALHCAPHGEPEAPSGGGVGRNEIGDPSRQDTGEGAGERGATDSSGAPFAERVPGGLSRGTDAPGDAELLEGDRALAADDLPAARRYYEQASRIAVADPAPQVGLVRVQVAETGVPLGYASGEGNVALSGLLREVSAITQRHPDYAPALVERGRLLLVLGRAEEALAALRAATALAPEDPEAQSSLGVALLATGRGADAVAPLERAVARDPRTAAHYTNLGTAYMIAHRVDDAIRAYRGALGLAANDARVHSDLGTAYLATGRTREALAHLERAVALEPRRATFLSNLAYAYQEAGDLERAVAVCREALAVDAGLGSAWINLSTALARLGRLDEARAALERARALDPDDPRVHAVQQELDQMRRPSPR